MKSNKCEITCMNRFNSIKVSAAVVAGLLLGAPVLLSTANVAYATVDSGVVRTGEYRTNNAADSPIVHFKDGNLKERIIAILRSQDLISANTKEITEYTASYVIDLNLNMDGITSLKGLEKFVRLSSLRLNNNQISDLTPLSGLHALEFLELNNNQISDLTPLSGLHALRFLELNNNQISDITPLANLPKLESLKLDGNRISDISPLLKYTKTDFFSIRDQNILFIPKSFRFNVLDAIKGAQGLGISKQNKYVHNNMTLYVVNVGNGIHNSPYYSATVNVFVSQAKKESEETQADDISEELQTLLGGYDTVKSTDNYKNADDKLKQAYDTAIKDGQKIYDKLSSTPEQVQHATEQIKTALGKLNGDSKSKTTIEGLQFQLDTAQQKLKKAEEQGAADKAKIEELKGQISTLNNQLEQLKKDKTKSEQEKQKEIDKLNGQITNLGKQIEKLTHENTSLKDQIAALQATISRLTEDANQCHASDGAHAQELEKVKQQLTQAQSDLEKLKKDKTKSEQEKQKEIERLSTQVTQLNQEITKLKQQPQVPPAPAPQVPVPQIPAPKPAPEPPAPRVPDKKELPQTPKQPSVKDSRDQIHLPKTNDILVGTLGVVVVACAGVALIAYGVYKRRQQH